MKRILVVDDNASIRRLIRKMLKKLPVQVKEAEDGEQALFLHEHETYDLVLTDLVLPRIDGGMLARSLRCRFPTLPVIMMSGQFAAGEQSCNYILFLKKPFDGKTLVRAVCSALGVAAGNQVPAAGQREATILPELETVNNH